MDRSSAVEKWDVNQERVFLENLMQTRFNFFLVVFGLWVVAVANIKEKLPKLVFLIFGLLICLLLWLTIRRICQKVIAALDIIMADSTHPATQVASAAGKSRIFTIRSNYLIGYVIPWACIFLLAMWGIYICCGSGAA